MTELICVSESTYRDALTRGERYTALSIDEEKHQVRIKGDNARSRWFPLSCFDTNDKPVPILTDFHIDDPIDRDENRPIEVTVKLSNGERRWCIFTTPYALEKHGDWIEGTEITFHYNNRHIIIAQELSEKLIECMLHYIDSQGFLTECTLLLEPD